MEGSGYDQKKAGEQRFTLQLKGEMEPINERRLEILLIEDNQNDVELFLNVVDWINMGDQVRVFLDGREALDFLHK